MHWLAFAIISWVISTNDVARAQEIPGAPKPLIGHYGKNPDQCRSYHRKSDNITSISTNYYTWCGGTGCEAEIMSHRQTKDGFLLHLASRGNPKGWTSRVTLVDKGIIEIDRETLVQCTERDIRRGVGRDVFSGGVTKSLDIAFSVFYALDVPNRCPDLRPDPDKTANLLRLAELGWVKHLEQTGLRPVFGRTREEDAKNIIAHQQTSAIAAVRQDAAELKDFCEEAAATFGTRGRVVPGLLLDRRKKA